MPQLRCSAQTCTNNIDQCCCKGAIKVAGNTATQAQNTCCSDFYEDHGGAKNAMNQEPTLQMSVACEATNCKYNTGCSCSAESIDVSGYNACTSDETCCSSFCER